MYRSIVSGNSERPSLNLHFGHVISRYGVSRTSAYHGNRPILNTIPKHLQMNNTAARF